MDVPNNAELVLSYSYDRQPPPPTLKFSLATPPTDAHSYRVRHHTLLRLKVVCTERGEAQALCLAGVDRLLLGARGQNRQLRHALLHRLAWSAEEVVVWEGAANVQRETDGLTQIRIDSIVVVIHIHQ